ncbi:MAG: PEP-CTERM sorting domain-containing protein [Planctomycetes bacterium]|nr:PEP-CTERM sorting domain-containing protein [Planctomycetota bacterium]
MNAKTRRDFRRTAGKSSAPRRQAQLISRSLCRVLSVTIIAFLLVEIATATNIPTNRDVNGRRRSLPAEGYLSHLSINIPGIGGGGEERTGWTDIRHPSNDGTSFTDPATGTNLNTLTNTVYGYDRSDHWVDVHSVVVQDSVGVTATPSIARDFNFANQIYATLGISVHNRNPVTGVYANVTFPINTPLPGDATPGVFEVDNVAAANRMAAPTVNNYYVTSFQGGSPVGFALPPVSTIAPNMRPNHGVFEANVINNDTMAHELGHFILDNYEFVGPNFHSPTNSDLMATSAGGFRLTPNANIKGMGNSAPSQPGLAVGNLGGRDLFNAKVDIPPHPGGGPATEQLHGIYDVETDGNAYVQVVDNGLVAADKADFDWVEDNIPIEEKDRPLIDDRADNHDGFDFLVWRIGPRALPTHTNHNHDAWGELNGGTYANDTFRTVDIFSQIAVYTDQDVDPGTLNWSPRESALDYKTPDFSADGVNWSPGSLIRVFTQGWTFKSKADDYVARWVAPFDSRYIRLQAATQIGFHDRNVQIDAIIASSQLVPEPTSIGLIVIGALSLLGWKRARRVARCF